MLILLSPAKSLDFEAARALRQATDPLFVPRAERLIEVLRGLSPAQVASLMDLSDPLAALNVARYAAWSPQATADNSKPAVLAFDGDVYDGLRARELATPDLAWAQKHLVILSGLYGALRPLDRLQPYRLEMGTKLAVDGARDLYGFWGDTVARWLNERQEGEAAPVVVNLASQEYFKVVDRKVLRARVIECVFEDWKDGRYKIISFFAKRARGLMARHLIERRARGPQALAEFAADGYALDPSVSTPDRPVFRRRLA